MMITMYDVPMQKLITIYNLATNLFFTDRHVKIEKLRFIDRI